MKPKFIIRPHITEKGKPCYAIFRRRLFLWYSLYWTWGYCHPSYIFAYEKDLDLLKKICEEGNQGLPIDLWARVDRMLRGWETK